MASKTKPKTKTSHKPYFEKLRDPKWQKKRLEIMQRDKFQCRQCRSGDTTLNVHHRWYEKGKEPWGYDDEVYLTLCDGCHEDWHGDFIEYQRMFPLSKIARSGVFALIKAYHEAWKHGISPAMHFMAESLIGIIDAAQSLEGCSNEGGAHTDIERMRYFVHSLVEEAVYYLRSTEERLTK